MADKYPTPLGKQPATSLLLSPPSAGFSFDDLSNNTVFLPVAQSNSPVQHNVDETDTFVGQPPPVSEPLFYPKTNTTSNPYSKAATKVSEPPIPPLEAVDRSSGSAANVLSNLHMPLRAPEPPVNTSSTQQPKSAPTQAPPPLARTPSAQYIPVQHHWFYCREIEKKRVWIPFSLIDSVHLEEILNSDYKEDVVVPTDGGRYDVHLAKRIRYPVFWEEDPTPVRRCSWFYRGDGEKRNIPYEEHVAAKLEEEYRTAMLTNTWYRRLEFPGGETIIIHNPTVIVHFLPTNTPDEWGNSPQDEQLRPRVVKRGVEDFDNIEDGEAMQIDHLVFVVHGIGGFCDLKFRTVTEVVDDFRSIGNNLLHTHFRKHVEDQAIGRVEFLPISWHNTLHGDNTGIDSRLQPITLPSIPKLRYFSNDTILDVLFYTSPVYCQTIVNQVTSEINRMYALFLERNPTFQGNVSLVGHSLGSVILFDILLNQAPDLAEQTRHFSSRSNSLEKEIPSSDIPDNLTIESFLSDIELIEYLEKFNKESIDMEALLLCNEQDLISLEIPLGPRKKILAAICDKIKENEKKLELQKTEDEQNRILRPSFIRRESMSTVNYMVGLAGTGQPYIAYPRLDFNPSCFFALGSPTAMFLTVRGLQTIGKDFKLPTCGSYFNIFHPFDPVAYRMEPLVDPEFDLKPVLIPHHKGRKRMHLEIKESLARVGSDLKQILFDSFKSTWESINEFARAHKNIAAEVEAQMDKYQSEQNQHSNDDDDDDDDDDDGDDSDFEMVTPLSSFDVKSDERIGNLNGGRRFDFVLQEKPIESFNEYLFALQSHMCYWESEDTVLLVLSEIYSTIGIFPTIPYHRPIFPQPGLTTWLPSQASSSSSNRTTTSQTPLQPPTHLQTKSQTQFSQPPPYQSGPIHSKPPPYVSPVQGSPFLNPTGSLTNFPTGPPSDLSTEPSINSFTTPPSTPPTSTSWMGRSSSVPPTPVSSIPNPIPPGHPLGSPTSSLSNLSIGPSTNHSTGVPAGVVSSDTPGVGQGKPSSVPPTLVSPMITPPSTPGSGMDPTLPMSSNAAIGPPPLTGFVRQGIKK